MAIFSTTHNLEMPCWRSGRPCERFGSRITGLCAALLFASMTAVSSQIHIPLPNNPVPITLQDGVVVASGLFLGARFGLLSQVIYILAGVLGIPVFAGSNTGTVIIIGPTGGYLIGFMAASWISGLIIEAHRGLSNLSSSKRADWLRITAAGVAGYFVVFLFGVGWLAYCLNDLDRAIFYGLYPFIPGTIIKLISCILIVRLVKHTGS